MTSQEERPVEGPRHAEGISGQVARRWVPGVLTFVTSVAGSAVVAAGVGAWITGLEDAANAEAEFFRNQRISAYAAFTHDLIVFEDDYRKASELLQLPKEQTPSLSAAGPSELIRTVDLDLDNLRKSKAMVDIVGRQAMSDAARDAINMYGPAKGEISDNLTARLKGTVALHAGTYSETLTKMQTQGRDVFTDDAKKDLGVPN